MKRLLVAVVVVGGALAIALSAQEQGGGGRQGGGRGGRGGPHTMTGCLAKADANGLFLVTDVEGNGPKSIGIVSSEANLGPHVGHKIAVTGTAVPPADAEAMKPAPPKAPHYMKLTEIKMVSATCP
jgi:hypothetical protein